MWTVVVVPSVMVGIASIRAVRVMFSPKTSDVGVGSDPLRVVRG